MRAADLVTWLSSLPPAERDEAVERHLGLAFPPPSTNPGDHLVGYHASGIAPIVRMLIEVPVTASDVVIDLGSGLGKVVILANLLTGAAARGIEIQASLVDHATECATRSAADVRFVRGDVRDADLDDGTVFFLYSPFTGPVLAHVVRRLHAVASRHAIVVCALGVELERCAPWLVRRPIESFWLTIYDSVVPNVPPRTPRERSPALGAAAEALAFERAACDADAT